ncbi:MAG: GxxExxY protein [Anaerolineales bacterium]|nr:GxxExxY protein [Anaerolineales bacterium]
MPNLPRKVYQPVPVETEKIGKLVLDAAYKVHTELGPGLLESVYQVAMKHVLGLSGTLVETEVKLPIIFEGVQLESALRIDMLVEKCVIAELKSVEKMNPVYEAQLITYLRLSKVRLGFLINFNVSHLKDGIKRIVV